MEFTSLGLTKHNRQEVFHFHQHLKRHAIVTIVTKFPWVLR